MAKQKKEKIVKKLKCCSCDKEQDEKEFSPCFSFRDRVNGRLSICKTCCSELYDRLVVKYQDDMKALYRFCMILDLYFSKDLATTLISKSKNADRNIGFLYLAKMGLTQYRNKTFDDTKEIINIFGISEDELHEMMYITAEKSKEKALEESEKIITPEVILRWGKEYSVEDYAFLEERYSIMLDTYENKNPASIWDMQELCINYLLLRKERGNVKAQKDIQEVINKLQLGCKMKISQLDNSEDDSMCYGKLIDKIENYEPCEKKLPFFDDIDNIKRYIKNWFVKPFAKEWGVSTEDINDYNMDEINIEGETNDNSHK